MFYEQHFIDLIFIDVSPFLPDWSDVQIVSDLLCRSSLVGYYLRILLLPPKINCFDSKQSAENAK